MLLQHHFVGFGHVERLVVHLGLRNLELAGTPPAIGWSV